MWPFSRLVDTKPISKDEAEATEAVELLVDGVGMAPLIADDDVDPLV